MRSVRLPHDDSFSQRFWYRVHSWVFDKLHGTQFELREHKDTIFIEALGAPIDRDIAPLVLRMNALGLVTWVSCQGDPGLEYMDAYVGFRMKNARDYQGLCSTVYKIAMAVHHIGFNEMCATHVSMNGYGDRWEATLRFRNEVLPEVTACIDKLELGTENSSFGLPL